MAKEEKEMPEWKKRVPYEESEAARHKRHEEPKEERKVVRKAERKEEKEMPEWKKRVPYEESEAARRKRHEERKEEKGLIEKAVDEIKKIFG